MPYANETFDAVYCVQVLEYIPDIDSAIAEIARVLRSGGRCVNLATNWDSVFWAGAEKSLTKKVLSAWDGHAPYPNMPVTLPKKFFHAGLKSAKQVPITIVNGNCDEDSFSYWIARLMTAFAVQQNAISQAEAEDWLEQLETASRSDDFFFSSVAIITTATLNK